jgi:hypothetical protein
LSRKGRKTAVLTVRLSKELEDVLLEDAEQNGITESSLVNRIVKKYVEWDRHAEKFRLVTVPAESFRELIDQMGDKTLADYQETINTDYMEAMTLFWFKKINLNTILETVNMLGRYSGLFQHEIGYIEGNHVITLKHGLGKKWSFYIGALINRFIKKELGVVPEAICTDETVAVTFRMDSSGSRDSAG